MYNQASHRVPKVEEFVLLEPRVLRILLETIRALKGVTGEWALGGDASEVVQGVNTRAGSIELIAFGRESAEAVHKAITTHFSGRAAAAPQLLSQEKKLARSAEIGGELLPVIVQSFSSTFDIDKKIPIGIHGSPRIKIGEWELGDPIEFEPTHAFIVGEKLPVMPLRLRSDIYFGLGWMDRVQLIHEANVRKHHTH
jgi:hypothetical protein